VRAALVAAGYHAPATATNFVWVACDPAIGEELESKGLVVRIYPDGIRITLRRPSENDVILRALGAVPGPPAGYHQPAGAGCPFIERLAQPLHLCLQLGPRTLSCSLQIKVQRIAVGNAGYWQRPSLQHAFSHPTGMANNLATGRRQEQADHPT